MKQRVAIYTDNLFSTLVGQITKFDLTFDIVRPAFDAQGRKRDWYQFVHDGIPIYENKVAKTVAVAAARFEEIWDQAMGANAALAHKSLEAVKKERRRRFKDGVSGEQPAPSIQVRTPKELKYPA